QPAAGDDWIAIGCAYYGHLAILKQPRSFVMHHAYLGRGYADDEVRAATDKALVRAQIMPRTCSDICRRAASLLADGQVLGWLQGRSEFGPRALGNRSILADPRRAGMKDKLHSRVQPRQVCRPFAPVVIAERGLEVFEGASESPFMLLAKHVRTEWQDKIPAVVHVDGTARVQTIREEHNPRLYRLLQEFASITGVPVL